uniref:Metalloendopeptidase n=1 Tax=Parastrongyloides trichosuri TaxID=131310 RepID=A0A0N4Z5C1_PARTI
MKRPLTKKVYYDIGKIMDLPLEHMRKERDSYIEINSDDDSEPYHDNIWEEYNISYDYGSRMHYPPITNEKNEKVTIDPLDENYLHTIGQDDEFNFNDYKKINALFCSRKCGNFQNSCLRNGFSNPNRCKTCLCPPHYKGRYCDEYKTTNSKCGKILFTATDIPQFILHKGVADCYFYINTDYKHVIEVTIIDSNLYETKKHCPNKKSLEIRYRKDPSVMGAMFCGINKNKTMVSEGNDVSIHYSSRQHKNWFMLSFRRIPSKVNEQCLKKL